MPLARATIVLLIALAAACHARSEARESGALLQLSLPAGGPTLTLPKAGWLLKEERRRKDGGGVYTLLVHEPSKLVFSLWIEKTTACATAEGCLQLALGNRTFREARDLRRLEVAPFQVAQFWLDQPLGLPIQQTHLLAGLHADGYWVDIHISLAGEERPDVAPLIELLRSVALQ